MSWFNQVKFFYTTAITMLAAFIWSAIIGALFKLDITFELFFLILIGSNLARYLLRRGVNSKICLLSAIIPIGIVEFMISSEPLFAILNIIFAGMIVLQLLKEEQSDISYEEYKRLFIRGVYYIFAVATMYSIIKAGLGKVQSGIFVGVLAYMILCVIALREAMGYEYRIKRSRGSKIINYLLGIFGILLTQDFVYNKLMFLAHTITDWMNYCIAFIVDILLALLKYPLNLIFSFLEKVFVDLLSPQMIEKLEDMNKVEPNETKEIIEVFSDDYSIIFNIIKMIIIGLAIYMIYKAVSKIYFTFNKNKNEEYTEIVESIKQSKNKEKKLRSRIKKLFRRRGSYRDEIIYKYGELVELAGEKDIFKGYMTPTQLKHVIKVKVNFSEGIDEITDIYNEAKFSTHEMMEDKQSIMEQNVNKLSKSMK